MTTPATTERPQYGADDLLTPAEASQVIRLEVGTLKNMRMDNTGPKYRKHGRRVLYRYGDLLEWSDARVHGGTHG